MCKWLLIILTCVITSLLLDAKHEIDYHPNEKAFEKTEVPPGEEKQLNIAVGVSDELFKVTAYCPCEICCEEGADGVTASGHVIKPGDKFVAAPKDLFEFGQIVEIEGYGMVPVLDRGGAIKGNRIDVFFPTHQEALEWGVRYIPIAKISYLKSVKI